MTDNAEFLIQNLHLFGFSSPAKSIFQTVKELVENSVDALKHRNDHLFRRQIRIVLALCGPHTISIDVTDNGCGIMHPALFIELFKSTKRMHSAIEIGQLGHETCAKPTYNGRYGVGLSCALIYSAIKSSVPVPLSILTKVHGQHTIDKYEFSVCTKTLNITSKCTANIPVNTSDQNGRFDCGTKIRIALEIQSDCLTNASFLCELRAEINNLRQYLERFHFLPTANITTELIIDDVLDFHRSALVVAKAVDKDETTIPLSITTSFCMESQTSSLAEQRSNDIMLYKEKFIANLLAWKEKQCNTSCPEFPQQESVTIDLVPQVNIICCEVHFEYLNQDSSSVMTPPQVL